MSKQKKWIQAIIFAAILIVGGLTLVNNLFMDHSKPQQGDKAPDFTLAGMDGKVHKLSDYKGKAVLINFWGTFCPPCKEEMPAMQHIYDNSNRGDIEFLAVNLAESPITVQSFVSQYNLSFPVLYDDKEEIRKRYGVTQYPTTFFVGPDGKIASIKIGKMELSYLEQTVAAVTKK